MSSTQYWNEPKSTPVLIGNEVHVWCATLDISTESRTKHRNTLSPDEHTRVNGLVFERPLNQFIAARGILRVILGQYLNTSPANIEFEYGPQGKPFIKSNSTSLQFNVSHSENKAIYAIAQNAEVGIDIEKIHHIDDCLKIAQRFFSPQEVSELNKQPSDELQTAFLTCWTRKESYIKAIGQGISMPLDKFSVSVSLNEPPKLISNELEPDELNKWTFTSIAPIDGYVGTVACEGYVETFQFFNFSI